MGYDKHSLEKVDLVRTRMGVGYAEAREALDEAGGDVVAALAAIELRQAEENRERSAEETLAEIIQEVKRGLEGRPVTRVAVKMDEDTLIDVPVAVAGLGVVLLTVLSTLFAHFRLELTPGGDGADSQ